MVVSLATDAASNYSSKRTPPAPLNSSVSHMEEKWSFVAMQYYGLILNRTYLVSVDADNIHGQVCRGLTSIESGTGLARSLTKSLAVQGDLSDPLSYISDRQLSRESKANFMFNLSEITSVAYNPRKKWGMGYYPHDGRVIVQTLKRQREFIILGNQSGQQIAQRLREYVARANSSFKVDGYAAA